MMPDPRTADTNALLESLTPAQRAAVTHDAGPLLVIAGAGTGKTTVITRRIAWLIRSRKASPEQILALTFSEKAAAEMAERIDLLVPYGYTDLAVKTFHAFGDQLMREYALRCGLSPFFKVLSQGELRVILMKRLFALPLQRWRPRSQPEKYLEALLGAIGRAKDETVTPEEVLAYAQNAPRGEEGSLSPEECAELGAFYKTYQEILAAEDAVDFGEQVFGAVRLLEGNDDIRRAVQRRYRYILVDEFQDTNFAQYRLLQLLAPPEGNVTAVGDDDQSIYKWRGAAISNMLKYLQDYREVKTVVLTDNFRSTQTVLDHAYRLIRHNDPDRLEVKRGIDKRLVAHSAAQAEPPGFKVFDSIAAETDWVVRCIREWTGQGRRRAGDIAILVRSNREAEGYLRAMNVAGIPWRFGGASGLFAREEAKILLSCIRVLSDPADHLSWYHVAGSFLYRIPMRLLSEILAQVRRTNRDFRAVAAARLEAQAEEALAEGEAAELRRLLADVEQLLEFSRRHSCGQVLYQWLSERGVLQELCREDSLENLQRLQNIAGFFDQLKRMELLAGTSLAEIAENLDLLRTVGNEAPEEDDLWSDRVHVLTLHRAKGLEFPVVFMVGLVQGRFPSNRRRDEIELPVPLIRDILPEGNYHLQEERRLFYVGMTRAKEELYLSAAYDVGGKTRRKVSQFILEALNLSDPMPRAEREDPRERISRAAAFDPLPVRPALRPRESITLDAHGVDDYLTCPLKYRYSHVIRIPVLRHHLVVYGSAVHKAVEMYFKARIAGMGMREEELLQAFEDAWSSDGFLTREHERQRHEQGAEALRRFYRRQQEEPETPTHIEKEFSLRLDGGLRIRGRWDRVDETPDGACIIDYKTSEIEEQDQADDRAKKSLQLKIYALAWQQLHGPIPDVELRFIESGLRARVKVTPKQLEKTLEQVREVEQGVRAEDFRAEPGEFNCRWCAFQGICPQAKITD